MHFLVVSKVNTDLHQTYLLLVEIFHSQVLRLVKLVK